MSEPENDTTETDPNEPSTLESDLKRHGYYYDDETGYEVYDPTKEDDDEDLEKEGDLSS